MWWLTRQGMTPLARNVEVERGEIDLVMSDMNTKVAVEVRTVTGPGDPVDAVDQRKRSHVSRLAAQARAGRVDYVGIGFRSWGIEVHWVPGVN